MDVTTQVEPTVWRSTLRALRQDGFTLLRFITAIDRRAHLDIVASVMRPEPYATQMVQTSLVGTSIDSVSDVWSGASWHERETAEMFGIEFDGLADRRPLLLHDHVGPAPLRKDVWLSARGDRTWPGAFEPGRGRGNASRRRQLPPGVPETVQP